MTVETDINRVVHNGDGVTTQFAVPYRFLENSHVAVFLRDAAGGSLKGILSYNDGPLVSIDFNHDPHSSCFDATLTKVMDGNLVKVCSWYDNEWGFSNRMIDTSLAMMKAR